MQFFKESKLFTHYIFVSASLHMLILCSFFLFLKETQSVKKTKTMVRQFFVELSTVSPKKRSKLETATATSQKDSLLKKEENKKKSLSTKTKSTSKLQPVDSLAKKAKKLTYAQELKFFLEKNQNYPRQALRLKQTGVVKVKLKIAADGTFQSIHVQEASSFPILDQAALRLFKSLGHFKPLPDELTAGTSFVVPIAYDLGET